MESFIRGLFGPLVSSADDAKAGRIRWDRWDLLHPLHLCSGGTPLEPVP